MATEVSRHTHKQRMHIAATTLHTLKREQTNMGGGCHPGGGHFTGDAQIAALKLYF